MAITEEDLGFLLAQRLMSSERIVALVGQRVRPDTLDPNEQMPAIRYEIINSRSWPTLQDSGREAESRFQVDCYGATRLEANTVAAAVKSNLDGFSGPLGSIEIFDCIMDNRYDLQDPPAPGSKHWRKRRTLDFIVTHTEPAPTHT